MKGILIPAILAGLLFQTACRHEQLEEKQVAFAMSDTMFKQCKFAKAINANVRNELRLFGKISADNNKTAQVFPIMSGVVQSIRIDLGDYVQQGQLLATVLSSEVAGLQKERLDAQSDFAVAEKNLQVAKDLFEGKLNSEKEVIAANKKLEKAKAELERINEVYQIYQLKSGSVYHITAPISGFVVNKKINQNEHLRTEDGSPVFSIAEINEVWVLANVNESDISRVQVGYDVEIKTLAFPDVVYTGKIDKIFNAIDPETKSMKVRIRVPNNDLKLKPEMNCTVSVKYSDNNILPMIPSSAVIFDKSKFWVMVFNDRKNIETRKVEVYRQLGDITYIKNGLKEGETVISENGLLIYDALND